jgi:hypothetical protein
MTTTVLPGAVVAPSSPTAAPSRARPWHPVTKRTGRFHWLLGARVAVAFVGPVAVAHVLGRGERDAPLLALAGLLVTPVVGGLPAGPTRRRYGPSVVAAVAAAALVWAVVAPTSAFGIACLVVAALAAGLLPLRSPVAGTVASAFALSLIVLAHSPAGAHTALMLLAGGAGAMALVVATDALRHPGLRLPPLPAPTVAAVAPDERRRHAVRLAVTIGLTASLAAVVGDGSAFAAHSSWMLLGVWIALQPHAAVTRHVALQRAAGTVAGGLLTVLLAVAVPGVMWIGWLFLALAFVAFGLRTVNYSWYCVTLTPLVVLGFVQSQLNVQILAARVTWTALGVALAVVARHLLWPDPVSAAAPVLAAAG